MAEPRVFKNIAILPISSPNVYPTTTLNLTPDKNSKKAKVLEKLKAEPSKLCLLLLRNHESGDSTPEHFAKVGVVCAFEQQEDESWVFEGQCRARIKKLAGGGKKDFFRADAEELDGKQPSEEPSDPSLLLGCVQAVDDLLKKLYRLVKSNTDLKEKLEERIDYMLVRDIEFAHLLPWYILITFSYLDKKQKQSILEIDDIIERLQSIIDILNQEIKIYSYSNGLAAGDVPFNNGARKE